MPKSTPGKTGAKADRGRRQTPREGGVQGEGDYIAGRRFQEAERSFAEKGPVEKGPEGAELERACREGKIHSTVSDEGSGGVADPHTEENLDQGLDETFPASDPVSISRGAD